MKTSILSSGRFNPGHISHLLAFKKMLNEHEFDVKFLCNENYSEFSSDIKDGTVGIWYCLFKLKKDDVFIIWSPSMVSLVHCLLVRLFCRCGLLYVYHEPFESLRSYRDAGFSKLEILRFFLISIVSCLKCALSTLVILPSLKAKAAFDASFIRGTNNIKLNLIFDDEAGETNLHEKKYISYIGTIAKDHAFNKFVNLVSQICRDNLLTDVEFLVCTKSSIPEDCRSKIEKCVNAGRLTVVSGNPMRTEEINDYYAKSLVIWNAYKRSMQSGVLPKAYMFGVPVITSLSGSSEYFVSDSTGLAISSDYKLEDFVGAISLILASFPKYSSCARAYFLKNFYYKGLSDQFFKGLNS